MFHSNTIIPPGWKYIALQTVSDTVKEAFVYMAMFWASFFKKVYLGIKFKCYTALLRKTCNLQSYNENKLPISLLTHSALDHIKMHSDTIILD